MFSCPLLTVEAVMLTLQWKNEATTLLACVTSLSIYSKVHSHHPVEELSAFAYQTVV